MRFFVFAILFLLCIFPRHISPVGVDLDLSLDKTNWIDPNDPLSHGHSTFHGSVSKSAVAAIDSCDGHCTQLIQEVNELRRMYSTLQHTRENTVDVLLKHILRGILSGLHVDVNSTVAAGASIHRTADVNFSFENLYAIQRYLASERRSEEVGLREDLRYALEGFITEASNLKGTLFEWVASLAPYVLMLNVIVLPMAVWNVLRSICSLRQITFLVLLSAFSLSCYFTYARKYQELLAQRFQRSHQKFEDGCTANGLLSEAFDVFFSYIRIKGKSECLQHYEDLLIEPIWQIDPLAVMAEVLSNFVLTPISVAGSHLNKFFNDFFINTPLYLAVVKIAFLLCFLFYFTGYRIRTIFGTIEPAAKNENIKFISAPNKFSFIEDITAEAEERRSDLKEQYKKKLVFKTNTIIQKQKELSNKGSIKPLDNEQVELDSMAMATPTPPDSLEIEGDNAQLNRAIQGILEKHKQRQKKLVIQEDELADALSSLNILKDEDADVKYYDFDVQNE